MGGFDKLELSTETLRELSGDELAQVAGGAAVSAVTCVTTLLEQTKPSGSTWFTDCETRTACA